MNNIERLRAEKISEETPPSFLKMYEIPGHKNIAIHHFSRYRGDEERWGKSIRIIIDTQDSLRKIQHAPERERTALIRNALNTSSIKTQKMAVNMIRYAPEGERTALRQIITEKIRDALNNPSIEAQKVAANMIQYAPQEEQVALIRDALNNPLIEAQKTVAKMIRYAPEGERTALIRDALNNPSIEAQKTAANMIRCAPKEEQTALFKQALEKLGVTLIEPPLYNQGDIHEERFSRKEFSKTGSRTTLIGGALKNKVIVRHMLPEYFLAWKNLYEDYLFWQDNGFDYVPIEPIVSFHLEKDDNVAVFSGVLDLSLRAWQQITSLFTLELEYQRNKILDALSKKGIQHGHPHDENFCLRFWRDEHGRPDMTKTPRLYLIDFD